MTKLKHYQWDQLRDWFCPEPGYVLDFSNKTFREFFEDHFETNIYADAFSELGTSKFNRLRAFITVSPPHVVIELIDVLWRRLNRDRNDHIMKSQQALDGDWSTVSLEYVSALQEAAAIEDQAFQSLVNDIGSLPSHSATPHLQKMSSEWTLDTVEREITRALEGVDKDPETAITAACSMLESVCRSIILGRGEDLPERMDIQTLYKKVRGIFELNPDKAVKPATVESDVRTILAALGNVISGIGALRTHTGSAHGRERGFVRVDPRIARLAVNSATSYSLFLIETWETKFPEDKLKVR